MGREEASGKHRRSCAVMSGRWDERDGEADARCATGSTVGRGRGLQLDTIITADNPHAGGKHVITVRRLDATCLRREISRSRPRT